MGTLAFDKTNALLLTLLFDNSLKVSDEVLPDLRDGQGNGDVDGRRVLKRVEVPSLGTHSICNIVDVQVAGCKGNDRNKRSANKLKLAADGSKVLSEGKQPLVTDAQIDDGVDDPMHAQNWPLKKKIPIAVALGFLTLTAAFGSR